MQKHTILFLAANPSKTGQLALDQEARAIRKELESAGYRDCFDFETRWAVEPLDLLRELRKLKPTVVHFSGHGGQDVAGEHRPGPALRRDIVGEHGGHGGEQRYGLFFQGSDGRAQFVSAQAIEQTFGAVGASVKLVVLNACYSDVQAEALLAHVDCVVGMSGSIHDDAARSFAIGFYGGLGERESVAAAHKQGRAAISLEGLHDSDLPQLKVRAGVDANQLVLAADPQASRSVESPAAAPQPSRIIASPAAVSSAPSRVDIGILTIRDDEFRAVLGVFPSQAGIFKGPNREYTLRHADVGNGQQYTVAVLRQVEQGNGEAQDAARDLIEDLAPRLVLVVGIAGGLPSDEVKLGDVILSTRIHDFTVEARKAGQEPTYAATGGPVAKELAGAVANLAGREEELGDWTTALPSQPPVTWTEEGQLYGPPDWQNELRAKLEHHHGKGSTPRAPVYVAGPIASSDRLVKDPALLIPWLTTARNLLAVEMESGGVYRAARERCPMLAIRGISDIVGLQRADAWTKFACSSAAAFTRAFLRTRPVPVGSWHDPGAVNRDGIMDGAHDREARTPGPGKKHAPWGWIFAIAGVCGLSLLAWRWWPDGEDRGPDAQPFAVTLDAPAPVPVPAGMVRFTGARIRSGIFDMSQRPAACAVLKPTEDCARSQDPREVPEIALDDFYLDKHEVTNQELASWLEGKPEMWRLNARDSAVIQTRTEPSVFLVRTGEECSLTLVDGRVRPGPGKAKQPATCMTWMAARDYCRANDKQLPLELEWEFAAKGSEGRAFPWGAPMPRLDGVSFDRGDSTEKHPVDVGTSNQDISPQGVHDLGGNVAEWVADEDGSGETATIRGGSWNSRDPCRLLGSSCKRVQTEEFSRDVGFRCAKRVAKDKGRE